MRNNDQRDKKVKKQEQRQKEARRKKPEKPAQQRTGITILFLFIVALLSLPSSYGVFSALLLMHDIYISSLSFLGYELFYIIAAYFIMKNGLRRDLLKIEMAAFMMAIVLNIIADYTRRVPGSLVSEAQLLATFSSLDLVMAIIESLALSGLAFVTAILMKYLYQEPTVSSPSPGSQADETTSPPVPALPSEMPEEVAPGPRILPPDPAGRTPAPAPVAPVPEPAASLPDQAPPPAATLPTSAPELLPEPSFSENNPQHEPDEPPVTVAVDNHQYRQGFGSAVPYETDEDEEHDPLNGTRD
jgi:hypothetical protein